MRVEFDFTFGALIIYWLRVQQRSASPPVKAAKLKVIYCVDAICVIRHF